MKKAARRSSTRKKAARATACPEFDDEGLTPSEKKAVAHDLRILASWGLLGDKPPRRKMAGSTRAKPARSQSRR